MVDPEPDDETYDEIAARTGRSRNTVARTWSRHPAWPTPTTPARRDHPARFSRADIDTFLRDHINRPTTSLRPDQLYTAREIEAAGGPSPNAINSEKQRGRWPAADDTTGRAHRWYGRTITPLLKTRQPYNRHDHPGKTPPS